MFVWPHIALVYIQYTENNKALIIKNQPLRNALPHLQSNIAPPMLSPLGTRGLLGRVPLLCQPCFQVVLIGALGIGMSYLGTLCRSSCLLTVTAIVTGWYYAPSAPMNYSQWYPCDSSIVASLPN